MTDFYLRVSEAAREALQGGQGDPARVVEIFRERAPGLIYIPTRLTPNDLETLHTLIEQAVAQATVVGGTETSEFASVFALTQNANPRAVGATGFLISADIVVTAAHALRRNFGVGIWRDEPDGRRTRVQLLTNPADLRKVPSPTHDIGLIHLQQRVSDIEIFSFANRATVDAENFLHIVGFGFDEENNFGTKKTARVRRRRGPIPGVTVPPDSFIIGDPETDRDGDACWHDSGGPVLVPVNGSFRLAGVIVAPVDQGVCGNGTFCLHVDPVTPWIDETIEELGGQPRPV